MSRAFGHSTLVLVAVAAPVAWALQLVGSYGVEEAACSRSAVVGTDAVEPTIAALTLLAALVALAAAGLALVAGLGLRAGRADPRGLAHYLTVAAAFSSLLFLLLILMLGSALLPFDACEVG